MATRMSLPNHFCWTRFGSEAGQSAEQILRRKEQERLANNGIFLWGIGNSVGPGIRQLVRMCDHPEVLFSPIRSAPKAIDASPDCVVAWTWGETDDGDFFPLPQHSLVTSRQSMSSPKTTHYALVCFSAEPLCILEETATLQFGALRNFVSGNPVGASQVTAVVKRIALRSAQGADYKVALRAHLIAPFFIRLRGAVTLPRAKDFGNEWYTAVQGIWEQRLRHAPNRSLTCSQRKLPFARHTNTVAD